MVYQGLLRIILLGGLSFLFLSGSNPVLASTDLKDVDKIPVATVNGVAIYKGELNKLISLSLPKGGTMHDSVYQKSDLRDKALEQLIVRELLYQSALKEAIGVDPVQVNRKYIQFRNKYGSLENFRKVRKASNLTEEEIKKGIERAILIDKMYGKILEGVPAPTEEEGKAEYEANLEKYAVPEQRRVRLILVKVDPSSGPEGWIAGEAKIKTVEQMLKEGDDFAEVAKEVSDDPSAVDGGDMGFVYKGDLYPEVEKQLDTMKPGEISPIGRHLTGFFILKLEEVKPSIQHSYEEVKERILRELHQKKRASTWEEWVTTAKRESKIVIME